MHHPSLPRSRHGSRRLPVVAVAMVVVLTCAACESDADPVDPTIPDGSTTSLPLPEFTDPPNPDAGAGGGATNEP